jgi:hypothetical protein
MAVPPELPEYHLRLSAFAPGVPANVKLLNAQAVISVTEVGSAGREIIATVGDAAAELQVSLQLDRART